MVEELIGYTDPFCVAQGAEVGLFVSTDADVYDVELVRLIHGDTNPEGPGAKSVVVKSAIDGTYAGKIQRLPVGSYVRVEHAGQLDLLGSFSVHMWIWPTMVDEQVQTLISRVASDGSGFALRLEAGRLSLRVGSQLDLVVRCEKRVQDRHWYSVTAVFDAEAGEARVHLDPLYAVDDGLGDFGRAAIGAGGRRGGGELLMAADVGLLEGEPPVASFYNGKIDAPRVYDRALAESEIAALRGDLPSGDGLVAAWDFSVGIPTSLVTDVGAHELHGRTVQRPTRGVTGHNFDGTETAWPHVPEQYGAIHFHDDDLDDAGWETAVRWTVPDDLPSGVYAARLRAGEAEDHVPFVVRPKQGRPQANIALVLPTFSYYAYANAYRATAAAIEANAELVEDAGPLLKNFPSSVADRYCVTNDLTSLYDVHRDGSGVRYATRLKPWATMRPDYLLAVLGDGYGSPHQLAQDLCIVDWLTESGYTFDVFTDDDLHREGVSLLSPYRVVVGGSHAEYVSHEWIVATRQYLSGGGRLMNMSGNGHYWVAQLFPDEEGAHTVEVCKRGSLDRALEPDPGEERLASTGEIGGPWRYRWLSPQSWLGNGYTGWGTGLGRPYTRQPDSFTERGSWVFDGIGDDELIGDCPSLVNRYGAAGFEIDRVDHVLGTPHHTLLLASASDFTDRMRPCRDEEHLPRASDSGQEGAAIRADMVLLEYPNGGAVFGTGSIAWTGCLSHNNYDNTVSRVTRNVLERFSSDKPAVGPAI